MVVLPLHVLVRPLHMVAGTVCAAANVNSLCINRHVLTLACPLRLLVQYDIENQVMGEWAATHLLPPCLHGSSPRAELCPSPHAHRCTNPHNPRPAGFLAVTDCQEVATLWLAEAGNAAVPGSSD